MPTNWRQRYTHDWETRNISQLVSWSLTQIWLYQRQKVRGGELYQSLMHMQESILLRKPDRATLKKITSWTNRQRQANWLAVKNVSEVAGICGWWDVEPQVHQCIQLGSFEDASGSPLLVWARQTTELTSLPPPSLSRHVLSCGWITWHTQTHRHRHRHTIHTDTHRHAHTPSSHNSLLAMTVLSVC